MESGIVNGVLKQNRQITGEITHEK